MEKENLFLERVCKHFKVLGLMDHLFWVFIKKVKCIILVVFLIMKHQEMLNFN
jgi:hypothetical protein